MVKPRVAFFDLETRKHARELRPDDEQAGWDALRRGEGGVSALVIYDTSDGWPYMYDDHMAHEAATHLEAADVVVGFYSDAFDIPVLEGLVGRGLRLREHIDIYRLIARANAERGIVGQKGDFKLDAIAKRTLGRGKIEHGADAPVLARAGKWARLFRYCADDVRLTRDLFQYICDHDGVNNPGGRFLPLDIPAWIKRGMSATDDRTRAGSGGLSPADH